MADIGRAVSHLTRDPEQFIRRISRRLFLNPPAEILYRDLFLRDLGRLGIEDTFYPVGGAANYGLLYLILRSLLELPIKSVLEFGAGQSSVLMSRIKDARKSDIEILTVEHDAGWAQRIGRSTMHDIRFAPLKSTRNGAIEFYDAAALPNKSYDLIIVDGPPASDRSNAYNRTGFADIVANLIGSDFVIVVDDAERVGERRLVSELRTFFDKRRTRVFESELVAMKRQIVFSCGEFSSVAFF